MRSRRVPSASRSRSGAHQDYKIEARDVDRIAFGDILAASKPGPAHAAAIPAHGRSRFDRFATLAHGRAPDARFQPPTIDVDSLARRPVFLPAQKRLCRRRLADTALPHAAVELLQDRPRIISLIGDNLAGIVGRRRKAVGREIGFRGRERVAQRASKLGRGRHQIALRPSFSSHHHRNCPIPSSSFRRNRTSETSSTRCYGGQCPTVLSRS